MITAPALVLARAGCVIGSAGCVIGSRRQGITPRSRRGAADGRPAHPQALEPTRGAPSTRKSRDTCPPTLTGPARAADDGVVPRPDPERGRSSPPPPPRSWLRLAHLDDLDEERGRYAQAG